jgi:hypothetical protein
MKKSFITVVLFLLAASLTWSKQQAGSASEASGVTTGHSEKPCPPQRDDRSGRDAKNKKNDNNKSKMKKAPAREEPEYDPALGTRG